MTGLVKISNLENKTVWEKPISIEEYKQIKSFMSKGHNTVLPFVAVLYPVRTNNLNNFAVDFFLPSTINIAIRVENVIGRVIATIAAIMLDVATLPIRLLTTIFRIQSNSNRAITPLHRYLLDQKVDSKLFETGYVNVHLSRIKTDVEFLGKKHDKINAYRSMNFNIIEMPEYKDWGSSGKGKSISTGHAMHFTNDNINL